ncbi:MAG: leucyl aminopeptidase [Micromonosporaceae bacterium]
MTRLEVRLVEQVPDDARAVAVPVFGDLLAFAPEPAFLGSCGFTAAAGELQLLPPERPGGPVRVVVGLGESRGPDAVALRRTAAGLARATSRYDRVALAVADLAPERTWPADGPSDVEAAAAVAEGFLLGAYRFTTYLSEVPPATGRFDIVLAEPDRAKAAVDRAVRLAGAVMLARDLVNEPGGALTPSVLAERTAAVAAAAGLACDVWDRDRIEAERLGGLLGVNRGSTQPPRMVRLEYTPPDPQGTVALVGKGVTFDSGGLTLKPIQMMFDMKLDMAGVAAVVGAMSVLRDVECPVRVLGFLPMTDNMSGGDATRLGDVLRIRNGTTVEIINADAEGRLLLADGLSLAVEAAPDAVVDLATLTLTVPMAVGRRVAGLAGNDPDWQEQVTRAAARAGEMVWPMPWEGVERKRLESKIADLVNTPHHRYGQSALAALFLRQFVPDGIPWVHLDMAGPSFVEEDEGVWSAGATGFGVRTLVELLCGFRPPT